MTLPELKITFTTIYDETECGDLDEKKHTFHNVSEDVFNLTTDPLSIQPQLALSSDIFAVSARRA